MPDSTPTAESLDVSSDPQGTIDEVPRSAKVRAFPAAGRVWADAHQGSELVLLPRAAWFPPVATLALVAVGNVAAFLVTALHIGRIRNELTGVQQKLELQRWQLERLALSASR